LEFKKKTEDKNYNKEKLLAFIHK